MNLTHSLIAIVVITGVTFFLRALPFIAGSLLQRYRWVSVLGNFLPPAMMALLLIHAIFDLAAQAQSAYWPECLSVLLTLIVHARWGKPLPSILSGTFLYIGLLQLFFA